MVWQIALPLLLTLSAAIAAPDWTARQLKRNFPPLSANQSVLPPGWSGSPECFAQCGFDSGTSSFLLGASFTDPVGMTIESCVEFCDQEGYIMAGLFGAECHCANIFNPDTCFESDFGFCTIGGPAEDGGAQPCPGDSRESCGNGSPVATPQLLNIFFKDFCRALWQGGAQFTSGPWRLIYFYKYGFPMSEFSDLILISDTVGARALQHNAVDLHPGLPRGNLTIEACVNACNASGFKLAGVEFADECYCGNELLHNSQPISSCAPIAPNANAMPCKGDPDNFCGGPGLLYLYSLPETGLTPLIPFDSIFDGYCPSCSQFGIHT
ncbi:hypothetical protein M422DRAFT_68498 [Sphaerobolus stellatus SS14]|uniref:WSC domain-containing protein n=1 Tax=Sphaerobolus stellatus (strain SS14) TaxID=990650 RepID=A0A0C9UCA2_SPHS4|nr:hypothetical protein M422DRAFT_68498 [Sphaerobolus stellatus SS14]